MGLGRKERRKERVLKERKERLMKKGYCGEEDERTVVMKKEGNEGRKKE